MPLSPDDAIRAFRRLGCEIVAGHGKKSYVWLELRRDGRQIAIFNVPTNRNPIPARTLRVGILQPNGIRSEAHLRELLDAADPRAAFLQVVTPGGPRHRFPGQPPPQDPPDGAPQS